jgi:hypothetical protein
MFPHSKLVDPASLVTKWPVTFYNGLSVGSLTLIGTWPANGAKLSIVASAITGHTNCGSIVTPGTVAINGGAPISFTHAGRKTSTVSLTAKPTIVTDNLDCNLVITCLDSGLAQILVETITAIDIKFKDEAEYYSQSIGGFVKRPAQAITDETLSEVGDVIRFGGIDYPIKAIHAKRDRLGIERRRILQF